MENFSFKDNRETLNAMLCKPDGVLAVIDEQSRTADGDADSLSGNIFYLDLLSNSSSAKMFYIY